MSTPTMNQQMDFWNDWVDRSRKWENSPENARRAFYVLSKLRPAEGLKILDIGCGSGWLALELSRYGETTATDLASKILDQLKQQYPQVTWIGGDFLKLKFPERYYNFVTCLETIAHVPDQPAFAEKIANLIRPGGTLALTTQNAYIWNRTSWLEPAKSGQIRNWPSQEYLYKLFSPWFHVVQNTTCAPGGNRGLPRLINNHLATDIMQKFIGRETLIRVKERLGFGCSLVLIAKRKQEKS